MFKDSLCLAVLCIAYLQTRAGAQTGFANMVDHLHLAAADPGKAVAWYQKYFDGKPTREGTDRLMFGETRMIFQMNDKPEPSSGSVLDHIGFSVTDLDATLKVLQADGVKIVQPARDVAGLFKLAFIEDPWGTRIEVVQDPELLGLHHIHMRGPDPEAIFGWLLAKFGGERTKMKGRLDAVRYRAAGFSDMWILVQTGASEPSEGHAIDHIGWRSTGPLKDTIDGLRGKGVTITSEPRPLPLPNGPTINFSYVAGPAGARIEIVERPGLKPGE